MRQPLVSVIIPVFNDAARLRRCLQALSAQTFQEPFEVLVVDNGSSDDPASVVDEFRDARLLREDRRSSYAARNQAITRAQGRILAFTDADCIPANDWLEVGSRLVAGANHPICVGGRVSIFPENTASPSIGEIHEMLNAFPQQVYIEQHSFSVTANMFVLAATLALVGGFDVTLASSGDREWGQRASLAGVKVVYASELVVQHPARRSRAEIYEKVSRLQRGEVRLREIAGEPLLWGDLRRLALRPPVRSLARDARRFPSRDPAQYLRYAAFALGLYYRRLFERLRLVHAPRGTDPDPTVRYAASDAARGGRHDGS